MTFRSLIIAALLAAPFPLIADETLLQSVSGDVVVLRITDRAPCGKGACQSMLCLINRNESGQYVALRFGPYSPVLNAARGRSACQQLGQAVYNLVLYAGTEKTSMLPIFALPLDLRGRGAADVDLILQPEDFPE